MPPEDELQRPAKGADNSVFPNLPLSGDAAKALVKQCNAFKRSAIDSAKGRKNKMRDALLYVKGEFSGAGDFLPSPTAEGDDRNADTNRAQIFLPVAKQITNTIYAQLKLTLFPNDDSFFRIRGTNQQAATLEDELTTGFEHELRRMRLTEKLGPWLWNLVWSAASPCLPSISDRIHWEWDLVPVTETVQAIDPNTGFPVEIEQPVIDEKTGKPKQRYDLMKIDDRPEAAIKVMNPLHFYVDPTEPDASNSKWVYTDTMKLQEILDSDIYFNKKKLAKEHADNDVSISQANNGTMENKTPLSGESDTNEFRDIEGNVDVDLYYFPFLKINGQDYRNMIVAIAGEALPIRFHPNLMPNGMNPVVFCGYRPDPESPYPDGPIHDILEIQRMINLLANYKLDVMSRIGNRFAVSPSTDLSQFWQPGGGVMVTENPDRDVRAFTGDYSEIAALTNEIGVFKAEAQITSGAQNPFQGSSNVDFKKTATELQIIQENTITILREVIEHVAITGVKEILERMMYLIADMHDGPVEIRVDDQQGTNFQQTDFRVLRSGDYYIDVTSANPGESKAAQGDFLVEVFQSAAQNPILSQFMKDGGYHLLKKIAEHKGLKDIDEIFHTPAEMAQKAQQQAQAQQQAALGGVIGQGQQVIQ